MKLRSAFVLFFWVLNASAITEEIDFKRFNEAQKCFKESGRDENKRIRCAQDSLDLGKKIFKPTSKNIITLTYNLAMAHPRLSSERYTGFERALQMSESKFGADSIELIDSLLALANEEMENRYINKLYDRAADIFSEQTGEKSISYATFCIRIAEESILYLNTKGHLRTSSRYAEQASKIFKEQLGSSSEDYAIANLQLAKNQLSVRKYRKAIPYLENALDNIHVSKYARGFLVTVYLKLDKPDLANLYSEVPKAQVIKVENIPYEVIFQNLPGGLSKKGWATVQFTISKLGRTDNIKVIDGSSRLHKRNLSKVVSNWRYKPAFVDGQPVDTPGVKYTYRWSVHKR